MTEYERARAALTLASQLPENRVDALAIHALMGVLLMGFLAVNDPIQRRGDFVVLEGPAEGLGSSPSSSASPSGR